MSGAPTIVLDEIMAAKAGSVDPAKFPDEIFDLYSIPAFDRGEPEVVAGKEIGSAKQIVEPGDVILSKIVPHIRRSWVVGANRGRRIVASGEWIVFRSDRVHPGYLRHVLVGDPFHAQFMSTVSGVGGSLLRARPSHVARINIPLPPLVEQHRIAQILDKADTLRAKRRAALARLEALTQAIFADMFGDPATNPKDWECRPLGAVATRFSDGPFGSHLKTEHYSGSGVRVVRLQNIGVGVFIDNDKAFVSEAHFAQLKKHECLPGDILIGTLGDPNLRACIQPHWLTRALNKADCVQLRPDSRVANAAYLCGLLNYPATERLAQNRMHGQTRVRISMGQLRTLELPMPPIDLQRRFAHHLAVVRKLEVVQRVAMANVDTLFASLQGCAFRGGL